MKLRYLLLALLIGLSILAVPLGWIAWQSHLFEREEATAIALGEAYSAYTSAGAGTSVLPVWRWSKWKQGTLYEPITRVFITSKTVDANAVELIGQLRGLTYLKFQDCEIKAKGDVFPAEAKLTEVDVMGTTLSPRQFQELIGLETLDTLVITGAGIDDHEVKQICQNKNLTGLYLNKNPITDQACEYIAQLSHLKLLGLIATKVDSAGIQQIAKCAELEGLMLKHTPIDDQAIVELSKLKKLSLLFLDGTRITDDSVPTLLKMISQNLKWCSYQDTQMTPEGMKKMDQAMAAMEEREWGE